MVLFLDMDGTIADFENGVGRNISITEKPPECFKKGFYRNLPLIEGAQEAVGILNSRYDIYIATKPKSGNQYCMNEKMEWIDEHFPFLSRKVFFTPNKLLLRGDILIDDQERWSNFNGEFILFDKNTVCWNKLAQDLIERIEE